MDALQTIESSASSPAHGRDRFLGFLKKRTTTQLRWPLVVICSYLLLYSPSNWLAPTQTYAIIVFYLLTNASLYFVAYRRFDSPYFYIPLLLLDAAFLTVAVTLGAALTPDFYLACFCTLILGCICQDSRGLLAVSLLAPALYGYVLFATEAADPPNLDLRLSVPFVISLLYGYFAQIERLRRQALEREEVAARGEQTAQQLSRCRQYLEALREVKLAITSSMGVTALLEDILRNALGHLPYSAALIRLRNRESGAIEAEAISGIQLAKAEQIAQLNALMDDVEMRKAPLVIPDLGADFHIEHPEIGRAVRVVSCVGVPMIADREVLGSLTFLARQERGCSGEDIDFVSALAAEVASAIRHSRLFQHVQEQASELRAAKKVKDGFLGVVSHEFRAPLNVISGYATMLSERMLGEIAPIQEKALQTILRQTKDLHAMIDSVLQVSLLEQDLVQPELQETNFWEFLYELKSYYDYPLSKDVNLVWNFSSDLPTLMADRGKLRQILQNLINNAIKFTNQGSVAVSAQYLHGKKCMEFKVADTGIGISKAELAHIFEKFRQRESDARAHGGVGLGLYIAKKCTEILHGTIHVESKPGKGSIFTIRVPCHARKAAEPLPARVAVAG